MQQHAPQQPSDMLNLVATLRRRQQTERTGQNMPHRQPQHCIWLTVPCSAEPHWRPIWQHGQQMESMQEEVSEVHAQIAVDHSGLPCWTTTPVIMS